MVLLPLRRLRQPAAQERVPEGLVGQRGVAAGPLLPERGRRRHREAHERRVEGDSDLVGGGGLERRAVDLWVREREGRTEKTTVVAFTRGARCGGAG